MTVEKYYATHFYLCKLIKAKIAHVSLAAGRSWSCMPKWQYGDIVDLIVFRVN